jgi:predicted ATP-dependent protease
MAFNEKLLVSPDLYCAYISLENLPFKSTDDLADINEFIGQKRAVNATKFGIGIKREGFNIFALGPSGIGKRSVISSLIQELARKKGQAKDICYIHNFKEPRHPKLLVLDAGMGQRLSDEMRALVEMLKTAIPAIFESKAYESRMREIQEEIRKKQEKAFTELEKEALDNNIAIARTAQGFVLAATKNGEILSEEDFQALDKKEREKKETLMRDLHEKLMQTLEQIPHWIKEQREQIKEAQAYFIMLQVGSLINDIKNKYQDKAEITNYLNNIEQAILENPGEFRKKGSASSESMGLFSSELSLSRYQVNVLVDNSKTKGAPIVFEDNPSLANLLGRIDQISQLGALVSDFSMIRAGALHKANGGFLLLDARKLLTEAYAYEGLKRALRAQSIRMQNLGQILGITGSLSLEPEALPLDIKIVLFGDSFIYYLLSNYDPEFLELFKVAADFDDRIDLSQENSVLFARLLKALLKKEKLRPLSQSGVKRVIQFGSRMVEDAQKISMHIGKLKDLLSEADYYASLSNTPMLGEEEIDRAILEQKLRASMIKEKYLEAMLRDRLKINTSGTSVGQINGLSVVQVGGFAFGHPIRISARTAVGRGTVIDIERESKLGGPIHSKSVLIIVGYLNGHFAQNEGLSLYASLVFEQSYGGVEGDSASLAELSVLMSALSALPINQAIAVTGSMDQHGNAQAVGGINEKIEGFFDLCKSRGLNGKHGVIIPRANLDSLCLSKEIRDAGHKKLFTIYAVSDLSEALGILCSVDAGKRNASGNFPQKSIFGKVEARLLSYAKKAKARGKN